MTRTAESLVRSFETDIMDLTVPMRVDFGFMKLSASEESAWFALLKDLQDRLKKKHGRESSIAKLHQLVISGSIVTEMKGIAKDYDSDSWPRFFLPETEKILDKVHAATAMYRNF